MGWSVGFDPNWKRDVGYGVPATCDHPGCVAAIDRGLGWVCGGDVYGGEDGCGLFFCGDHGGGFQCERCAKGADPFDPTPDTAEWVAHKLTDESWQRWRDETPEEVARLQAGGVVTPGAQQIPAACTAEPWYGDRDTHEVDQAYGEYDGTSCELCHRERVMIGGATGKRICEKCGSYQAEAQA